MDKPIWMWGLFIVIVVALLAFDLGVLHRKSRKIGVKESLKLSLGYIIAGLSFGLWIWYIMGSESAEEYVTGYLVEKTLALDNIFVISLIFQFFKIPSKYQHRVLFWGILGVIVLRAILIGIGAVIVSEFSWVMYLFSVFLIYTGIKMIRTINDKPDISKNILYLYIKKKLPITKEFHGDKFYVYLKTKAGNTKLFFTPLFIALILIEFVDLVFAVDSVPAIFAITDDPYIVYTSNIFAILGLRALYFALDSVLDKFVYLKYSLSVILIFIGSKIFISDYMGIDKFPASISLGVSATLILIGIVYSLYKTKKA